MAKREVAYRRRVFDVYVSGGFQPNPANHVGAVRNAARHFKARILPFLPRSPEARILELGCGQGRFLKFVEDCGYRNMVGVDVSAEQVEVARKLCSSAEVCHGDVLDYLAECEPADVIVAIDLIEHLTKEELIHFLELTRQRLRPEGVLVLQTPNAASPLGLRQRYHDFTHEISFDRAALTNLLRLTGFEATMFLECGPVVHGVKSSIRWLAWKFIRLLIMGYMLVETGTVGSNIYTQVMVVVAKKLKTQLANVARKERA